MTVKPRLHPGPNHPITVEPNPARVTVVAAGREIASSTRALTLREASHPVVQYLPIEDVDPDVLVESDHATYCPFKGDASYYSLRFGDQVVENAVWTYRAPYEAVAAIRDHVAFYPRLVDRIEENDAG
jgi:uncharacterized protein (DUF427 family)